MFKIYSIQYVYDGQTADASWHFVHAKSERVARVMAEEYIEELLRIRFGRNDVAFEIKKIEVVHQ